MDWNRNIEGDGGGGAGMEFDLVVWKPMWCQPSYPKFFVGLHQVSLPLETNFRELFQTF